MQVYPTLHFAGDQVTTGLGFFFGILHSFRYVFLTHRPSFSRVTIIKANRLLGFLKRNLHSCHKHFKEYAYKQFLLPSIEYCCAI